MNRKSKSCLLRSAVFVLALIGLCLFLAGMSAASNQHLPVEDSSDTLSELDKARLTEALHLKNSLGDQVWLGWGQAHIPVIVWNQSYEFLANYDGKVPPGWSTMEGDNLDGQPYFRRKATHPQNFAIQLGNTWTASIATKRTTDVFLINAFRENLPAPLKQIFPYYFLLQPSETQIGGLLHESFHVYQYQITPERMAEAESIHRLGDEYEASANTFASEWKKESLLLADALEAETQAVKIDLVRQFLRSRGRRRIDFKLENILIDYERWLEWEEGTAKYIEVAILKKASESASYRPVSGLKDDPDFKQYLKAGQRWSQEIFQLRHQMPSGETRFYQTGMAQAFLLDELMPGWKEKYWDNDMFLEDLLRLAVAGG